MKTHLIGSVAALCIVGGFGVSSAADDSHLGPMADLMANRVGTWKVEMSFRPSPNGPETRSLATQSSRIVAGKWLVSELRGTVAGHAFSGIGINAYNEGTGRYVGVWIDSASNVAVPVDGRYDSGTRRFITESDEVTPAGKQHVISTTTVINRDTEETSFQASGPDGKTFTRMTMRLTRAN